jgi:hypothetical protein
MPHYIVRHVRQGGAWTSIGGGMRRTPALQMALDDRVTVFGGLSFRQRLMISWSLLRGGMTIVEAP